MIAVETKTLFVAILVGLAHIISGIAVLVSPDALNVTPLASLHHAALALGFTGTGLVGATLISVGLLAVVGGNIELVVPRWTHWFTLMPQEILLLLQLYTITTALISGAYPDGYIPQGGAWFILTDQIWAWILAVSHSIWLGAFLYGGNRGINRAT